MTVKVVVAVVIVSEVIVVVPPVVRTCMLGIAVAMATLAIATEEQ